MPQQKSKKNHSSVAKTSPNQQLAQVSGPKSPIPPTSKPKKAPSQPSLAELYKTWDKKLKESGFKDIERRSADGKNADDLMNGHSLRSLANTYKPETELYYKRLTHYLTHVNNPMRDILLNQIARWLAEAVPYREITRRIRAQGGRMNIQKVHKINQELLRRSTHWNKTNPNGVDFSPDLEYVPLRKFKLQRTK